MSSLSAPLRLFAAGSLQTALQEMAVHWQHVTGGVVAARFGPAGLLRAEIEGGAACDVFASASVTHTAALAAQGVLASSTVFAHNRLCVLARPELGLQSHTLLAQLLDPAVRLATSTPGSDPMGDYTWEFFRRADAQHPGAGAQLAAKAIRYSGAALPAPGARLPYLTAFEQDVADAYVMYVTNAQQVRAVLSHLILVQLPSTLDVRSACGIGAAIGSAQGADFVRWVLAEQGQRQLRAHGFEGNDGVDDTDMQN